jgi:hypothetical protein
MARLTYEDMMMLHATSYLVRVIHCSMGSLLAYFSDLSENIVYSIEALQKIKKEKYIEKNDKGKPEYQMKNETGKEMLYST